MRKKYLESVADLESHMVLFVDDWLLPICIYCANLFSVLLLNHFTLGIWWSLDYLEHCC